MLLSVLCVELSERGVALGGSVGVGLLLVLLVLLLFILLLLLSK